MIDFVVLTNVIALNQLSERYSADKSIDLAVTGVFSALTG